MITQIQNVAGNPGWSLLLSPEEKKPAPLNKSRAGWLNDSDQINFRSTATVRITDDLPESISNPIDDAQAFVYTHYHDFLNREPDPAGLHICYGVSDRNQHVSLYRLPVFGGPPEKLHDNVANPTFSPDGKQFAFLRYDESRKLSVLMAAETSGGSERELAKLPPELSSDWHGPAWSPDGLNIVVAGVVGQVDAVRLFVVSLRDGSTKLLNGQTWRTVDGITWLKDGSGVVCVGLEKSSLHPQLWFIPFPNGEAHQVITDLNDYGYVTSLANDNSYLCRASANQTFGLRRSQI